MIKNAHPVGSEYAYIFNYIKLMKGVYLSNIINVTNSLQKSLIF
jgi:hypothetical protein